MDYTGWRRVDMVAELTKRGLPTYGNQEQIRARLEADELTRAKEAPTVSSDTTTVPGPEAATPVLPSPTPVAPSAQPAAGPEIPGLVYPGLFRVSFLAEGGDLSDGMHAHNIAQTIAQAKSLGLRPKGGGNGAHRVGWGEDAEGRRTAVYELHVRR